MARPDYDGGSILNLMSSIIQARGGRSDAPSLRDLPTDELAQATNLILLVIDGLGADWLARRSPDGILSRARRATLTSVFPSTTAAAIPTFLTGEAPLVHGLTGWHTYLGELGCVMTVLPGTPRFGGVPYRQAGIDPVKLFGTTPVSDRITTRSVLVSPAHIARSDFNRAHLGRGELVVFKGLRDMFTRTAGVLRGWGRRREPKYLYLYWPGLDAIGHEHGMESPAAQAHLLAIEQEIATFMHDITDTDSLLLISADHGQLDTSAADAIDLADHPELESHLLLPLCGEPRAAFCYLRSGHADAFRAYCSDVLVNRVDLVASEQLVEEGLFGTGRQHVRFMERVGDVCLLPKANGVIRQWLPFEQPHQQIGVHGGLSEAELRVPLCLLRT
ncbi:alkaline phosphatase family protein [Thiocapsa bogorovii]|uniref:alkaline phosphatase family protein n=1 Tax=Thiocapsa bogorovii TaxID=521689 RepID=UPI001E5CD960|nr:alkaline phosphatase family protein [Thiocapsa bogorovii]UHD15926.1 alkaline phosphatase family protein [Thiocapsa bogorovii]